MAQFSGWYLPHHKGGPSHFTPLAQPSPPLHNSYFFVYHFGFCNRLLTLSADWNLQKKIISFVKLAKFSLRKHISLKLVALHLCRYGYDWVGTLSKDIFEKYWILHLCRYGYDGVGKDALSLDIFYHGTEYFTTTECQRAYATHASLWSLLSIYLASYFIHQIQGKIFSLECFSFYFGLRFLFSCRVWGLSCWKVFMRYLRCQIFNIKMPSCLVLLNGWRMYAKLIFSCFSFSLEFYRYFEQKHKSLIENRNIRALKKTRSQVSPGSIVKET